MVEAARVAPEVRPVLERIAVAYEDRQILPELCGVRKFLASEGVDPDRVRSRDDALRKLIRVLATRRHEELESLFGGLRKQVELGDLGLIAEAILGPRQSVAPAGERQRPAARSRRKRNERDSEREARTPPGRYGGERESAELTALRRRNRRNDLR